MTTIADREAFLNDNGYELVMALGGYYFLIHRAENEDTKVVWMDSASEDAYDYDSAVCFAYNLIFE